MLVLLPAPSDRGLPGWAWGLGTSLGGSAEAGCLAGVTVPDAGLTPSLSAPTSASTLLSWFKIHPS